MSGTIIICFPTGLPTYLVVMAIGLNQTKSGSVQLQSVNLEARTGSLGELKLQRRDSRIDLFVAELPPTLSTTNSFSIVVHGMDGEGQKLERSAPQVATVTGSLLEVRGKLEVEDLGCLPVFHSCILQVSPFPAVIVL